MKNIQCGEIWKYNDLKRIDYPYVYIKSIIDSTSNKISITPMVWIEYYYLDDENQETFYRDIDFFVQNFEYDEYKTNEKTIKDIIE
jgi:hypothetical protein